MSITIYGTPSCPNCVMAKNICEDKGLTYEYKTVGLDISKVDLAEMVARPVRSVPVLIEDGCEITMTNLRDRLSPLVHSDWPAGCLSDLEL